MSTRTAATTVAAIDPSLASTGLARLTTREGRWVAETSLVTSTGRRSDTLRQRHQRLRDITTDVTDYVADADLVVIEGPAMASRGGSTVDRHGLWWRIVATVTDRSTPMLVVPPTSRAKFATGKGNADKAAVAAAVVRMWPEADIATSDAADALALASLGAAAADLPVPFPLPQYRTDVLAAVVPEPSKEHTP
ncbi:Holliday junction resolvasome RuvABC endonuclease subunit [Actinopolyspora alba]|uniref:Holliday junction resolvasome RuvABC endonuclease subunit n=1 Tax=Actinopolyspora alba TaxID=673379 RepID=A0A1I2BIZ1_9ACTN|nr:crossover junction endodeoxyribonuclease RuvC [Actinopolyspora alba]SFE55170.1 Holliday junction resolvasome RuvABC endonuclease subunit [Actinopolyspora alba]